MHLYAPRRCKNLLAETRSAGGFCFGDLCMKETHEFGFRGVWTPADVLQKLVDGVIKPADVPLLIVIDALVKDGVGCFASNEYLAKHTGRGERQTRDAIGRLKTLGLLTEVGFDGRKRYLETAWSRVEHTEKRSPKKAKNPTGRVAESRQAEWRNPARQSGGISPPDRVLLRNTNMSAPKTGADGGGKNGFGMVGPIPTDTTPFDTAAATKLLEATRKHLGPSHLNVRRAKPTQWAAHFQKLRTLDEVSEERITKTLDWYTRHMDGEYAYKAHSGAAFRKKFPALEEAAAKDFTAPVVMTPAITFIMERLNMLHWPKGAAERLPAAISASLEGYNTTHTRFRALQGILERNENTTDLGRRQKQTTLLAQQIVRLLPGGTDFVLQWFRDAHARVVGWEAWSGDLSPYIFRMNSKRFRNMGREWAGRYNDNPDTWDRLIELLQVEVP